MGSSTPPLSRASRLSIVLGLAILFIVGVCGLLISHWLDRYLQERSIIELKRVDQQVVDMVDAYAKVLENSARLLGEDFASRFPTPVRDTNHRLTSGHQNLPTLRSTQGILNNRADVVDTFTDTTGATATVFVRDEEGFFRITTSVRQQNGERALGTALGSDHPAYALLLAGHAYTGQVTLFGRRFMTHYKPLFDASGTVVGAAYIGVDFTDSLQALSERMLAIRVGETGYVYALDAVEQPGRAIVHPARDEMNAPDSHLQGERNFIQEMLAKKSGIIRYPWANGRLGESEPRDKVVVYTTYAPWGWIVAASAYADEIHSGLRALHLQLLGFALLITASLLVTAWLITRQFEANEQTLIHARQDAEAASRAKSNFLATISHEIRTPLNGVLGMSQLLMVSGLDQHQQGYAQLIKDNGEALLKIINDILDFSKIEADRLELEQRTFLLPYLITSVAEVIAVLAREKQLTFTEELAPDLPQHIVGDEARLRQVLFNLLGNAVKFTASGIVTLKVDAPQLAAGQVLRVSIIDTGTGIAPEKIRDMFSPFTQADSSITRSFGGTGLGLTIAKRLVELMGGQIGAESIPGRGSTFHFTIPCHVADEGVDPLRLS
ncbi:MAG TPA: Cache 3/Cache 2 fusion domain-containing protein [Rhodocyclaceae bacterium]|jgi:signal transduction histidine kinase|nr:Cache 3/Cache 2 fusion domain-containing protein [Rhodocyclaceae bacterium]